MRILKRFLIVLWALTLPAPLLAQDDDEDRGFVVGTLENALSGPGRFVRIEGFEGALSSEATMERMEIADEEGVWLTLENVVLDWSRLALLRGRLEVERLSAERLDIPRLPIPSDEVAVPDAEATGFALPELPVTINVQEFEVEAIALGAPILGEAAELTVSASARLDDDGLQANVSAQRTDGRDGELVADVSFGRESNDLNLDLQLEESPGGLAARALQIPGSPSVSLTVAGQGPLSDFAADIGLSTDGQERIAGRVTLTEEETAEGADLQIAADVGGDVTAIVLPQYHEFFGPDVRLRLDALRRADGSTEVRDMRVTARALDLSGQVRIDQANWPSFIDVTGTIVDETGSAVILPVGGVTVDRVDLSVSYDAAQGDALSGRFDITELEHEAATVSRAQLALDGTLVGSLESVGQFLADLTFEAEGLGLADESAGRALGEAITGQANINYVEGQPIRITDVTLRGDDYGLVGQAIVGALEEGFPTRIGIAVDADDLSRFSALSGQTLSGAADVTVAGNVTPLAGFFDVVIDGSSQDLGIGIPEADAALAGRTVLSIVAARNDTGTFLRDMTFDNDAMRLTASAFLRSNQSEATLDAEFFDVAVIAPQYSGPLLVKAEATQDGQGWVVDAGVDGPYDTRVELIGRATGPNADLKFDLDVPEIAPLVPDLSGAVTATGRAFQSPEGWRVDLQADGPYQATVALEGLATGADADLDFDLSIPDIEPLAPGISGAVSAQGNARNSPEGWRVDLAATAPYDAELSLEGLATGPDAQLNLDLAVPDLQPLVPSIEGALTVTGVAAQSPEGWRVDLDVDGPYEAQVALDGLATGTDAQLNLDLSVPDLQPLIPTIEGALTATGVAEQTPEGWRVDLDVDGPYQAKVALEGLATGANANLDFDLSLPDVQPLVPQVSGPLTATGNAQQSPEGWRVDLQADGPFDAEVALRGLATGPESDLAFELSVPDLQPVVPQVTGGIDARGNLRPREEGLQVDLRANGPYGARLAVAGLATGPDADINVDVAIPNLQPLVPQVSGPVEASSRLRQTEGGWMVDANVTGPQDSRATLSGLATGPEADLNFEVQAANVGAFVPQVNGPLSANGRAFQSPEGWRVDLDADGPYSSEVSLEGLATGPDAALTFSAAMPNVAPLVGQLSGPLAVQGTANRTPPGWQVDTTVDGPAGMQAAVAGLVGDGGQLDLTVNGTAPLGLAQPFLAPRSLAGQATFDLTVNGPPALSSVSGNINIGDATFSAPNLRIALVDISSSIALNGAQAQIQASASPSTGGQITAGGTIALDTLAANLEIGLVQAEIVDPRLYRTLLNGRITVNGPLTGGARIAGQIDVGETLVTVPNTGLTSIGDIPPITHIGETGAQRLTRARAGVLDVEGPEAAGAGAGPAYPLDLVINAPGRIFVRGRGLDAELGGSLRLTGTTARPISSGSFELQRGRLDILGQRFELVEGRIEFQGDLTPYLYFVTSTTTSDGTASVILDGPADEPTVSFSSSPEAPEDEVISQLLFGKNLSEISALQALQLANAVAVLAGRGGVGLIGSLREGFGLDDFDVTTTEDGETAVRAGKYLTEDIYTDVTSTGSDTEISLNFDITDSFTAKGTVDNEGNTGVGIFFERDY
ncbi:translocation/assembly module TamB domain-containing protein [Sulfitobacter sp. D35]|uniref:translocation/assembly module TamB domain-containing protein n=1 Tax=Sulfitobacter sp. D35 TaxID=3083252 RepID=UPI00296F2EF8|nr:translocation/assembly module TamB domain-containing protein [Sulfitobacter sp. D35]MDW4496427.1 translocation/assembly module TamB domain-containing protein [Sulfitobacter sp. D35]